MAKDYKLATAAIGVLLIVTLSLGTGAFVGALYAPHSHHDRLNQQQHDNGNPSASYIVKLASSRSDPSTIEERQNRDLAAQESMSVWAFWVLIVSSIGTIITCVGTALLLWQIVLTRKAVQDSGKATLAMQEANKIASETQVTQLRSYVKAKSIIYGTGNRIGKRGHYVYIRLLNKGIVPAGIKTVHLKARAVNRSMEMGKTIADSSNNESNLIYTNESATLAFLLDMNGIPPNVELELSAKGFVEYEDRFSSRWRTDFHFAVPQAIKLKDLRDGLDFTLAISAYDGGRVDYNWGPSLDDTTPKGAPDL